MGSTSAHLQFWDLVTYDHPYCSALHASLQMGHLKRIIQVAKSQLMSVQALKVALGVSLARKFTLWEMIFTFRVFCQFGEGLSLLFSNSLQLCVHDTGKRPACTYSDCQQRKEICEQSNVAFSCRHIELVTNNTPSNPERKLFADETRYTCHDSQGSSPISNMIL